MYRNFVIGTSQGQDQAFKALAPKLWVDRFLVQSGGKVSQWTDRSGNGNHFIQSSEANKPDYSSSFGGSLHFDGTIKYMDVLGSTGLFNYLHNGAGGTLFLNISFNDIGSISANQTILDNGGSSTARVGQYIYASTSELLGISPTRGIGGTRTYNYTTSYLALLDQSINLNRFEYQDARAGNDALNDIIGFEWGGETQLSPSVADATDDLRLGAYATGGNYLNAKVNHISIFDRILTAEEITTAETYINSLG